jgi:hypothetical protein
MIQKRIFQIMWLVGLVLFLFWLTGCDSFQTIEFENGTQLTVQTNGGVPVPKDWDGKATFKWEASVSPIPPGQTRSFATSVHPTKVPIKYLIQAVDQNNELVFSKIFNWDELHDSGWKVVISQFIEGVKPGDSTSMGQTR